MSIKDKIWWTRKAKIEQEIRLLRYEFHSQVLLIWYSFFTVAISILQSQSKNMPFESSTLLVFSVLTLVMSGIVSAQKFHSRSEKVKKCYEQLNTLILSNPEDIVEKYEYILSGCENHIKSDHHISKLNVYFSTMKSKRNEISPPLTFKDFFEAWLSKIKYYLTIAMLYTLPFTSSYLMSEYIK
ncbi:SLATT domain-containing protein [Acinetobacter lwoffii]|jgi:hypothetical protein|uniref:SLATT domain-containing protein n=1 Tax=Acinetobacter lwoffii TaxID=28090 RepID=UPI001FF2B742|nr:SLATT domain-containing protein [Acinetobacter lwoffii]MCJ8511291.1 SLATT domain-containing protein [Acinetobacter lwoffii]